MTGGREAGSFSQTSRGIWLSRPQRPHFGLFSAQYNLGNFPHQAPTTAGRDAGTSGNHRPLPRQQPQEAHRMGPKRPLPTMAPSPSSFRIPRTGRGIFFCLNSTHRQSCNPRTFCLAQMVSSGARLVQGSWFLSNTCTHHSRLSCRTKFQDPSNGL